MCCFECPRLQCLVWTWSGGPSTDGTDWCCCCCCCCCCCSAYCSRACCRRPNWRRMARRVARIGHRPGSSSPISSFSSSKNPRQFELPADTEDCLLFPVRLMLMSWTLPCRSKVSSTVVTDGASATNKPELCVDLNGTTIEWVAVKSKTSRKGVFQVSSPNW